MAFGYLFGSFFLRFRWLFQEVASCTDKYEVLQETTERADKSVIHI